MLNPILKKSKTLLSLLIVFLSVSYEANAQQNVAKSKDYFTIESYYKVKWGHAAEFINLWKQNHYPLLKKALEKGDIISITASEPKFHSGEETRWDFRVSVVFKSVNLAFEEDLLDVYKKQLFPDSEALDKSEQYRFELLLAHWDIETGDDVL
jgi:flagellar basal body L-ring protein FlgH